LLGGFPDCVLVLTFILAGSSLSNWYSLSLQNDRVSFRGQYFDPQDYAVDIAMMRAGMQGDWAYHLRFTTEEHKAASIRLFCIALGYVSNAFDLDAEDTYEIARRFFG
jgi:hypothetical protein